MPSNETLSVNILIGQTIKNVFSSLIVVWLQRRREKVREFESFGEKELLKNLHYILG